MRFAAAVVAVMAVLTVPAHAQIPTDPVPENTAFEGNGMWIWYVSASNKGSIDAIARRARRAGVTTLFIKSSDGPDVWSQFSTTLINELHERGLNVCGWGYVYGTRARAEARAARTAIARGADCFVIDAETEYEGKYAKGDFIIWAQQHLADGGYDVRIDGVFDTATSEAITDFQTVNALPITAKLDPATWQALLTLHDPLPKRWAKTQRKRPATADIPAVRNELRSIR